VSNYRKTTILEKKKIKNVQGTRIPNCNSRTLLFDRNSSNVSERCQEKLRIIAVCIITDTNNNIPK
jgi:hypothetical protein